MEEVVAVSRLRHTYDGKKFVVEEVSFDIRKGEIFGLIGRNGAGKTTVIKILTTLIRPTSGEVSVLGFNPITEGEKIRERIGVVQQGESYDFTTVEKNLELYAMLWGVGKEEAKRRKEELILSFGLESIRKKNVVDISGGEKRRLQVAREFMHDMDLLFLDEPTVGIDVIMRRELLNLIKKKAREGLTILFTTHNLEEADYLCDRIAIIAKGRILALDTVDNLKKMYTNRTAIELQVDGYNSEKFFRKLAEIYGNSFYASDNTNAVISSKNPRDEIPNIIDLASRMDAQIEYINVRKSTLEDVLVELLSKGD